MLKPGTLVLVAAQEQWGFDICETLACRFMCHQDAQMNLNTSPTHTHTRCTHPSTVSGAHPAVVKETRELWKVSPVCFEWNHGGVWAWVWADAPDSARRYTAASSRPVASILSALNYGRSLTCKYYSCQMTHALRLFAALWERRAADACIYLQIKYKCVSPNVSREIEYPPESLLN